MPHNSALICKDTAHGYKIIITSVWDIMKIQLSIIIFLSFLSLALGPNENPSCEHTKTSFHCVKYLKNYDGDTITFNIPKIHSLLGKSKTNEGIVSPSLYVNTKFCTKETASRGGYARWVFVLPSNRYMSHTSMITLHRGLTLCYEHIDFSLVPRRQ